MSVKEGRGGRSRVLVVDDEADIRELFDMTLARMGLDADCVGTLREAKAKIAEGQYRLCLTDMRLPDGEGLALVRHINEVCPQLPVAVITAHGSMQNAVAALKAGAFDYLSKPVSLEQLRVLVKSAIELPQGNNESVDRSYSLSLLGESAPIQQARSLIERVARSQAPVYISGESGCGKELAARLIHCQGARALQSFIAVNCGAIPENLMESEFFGYRKGAFTGAEADRDGFFQAASGGTLFLDEVADLPLPMQVKLLRAIQEKRVRKVGSTSEEPVDVRIICATHQNLRQLVDEGRFRQDLFYRLNVIEIRMPPLRECREDIPLLANHLIARLCREAGRPAPPLSERAVQQLCAYAFPGNVRELENILERALALFAGERIEAEDLQLEPGPAGEGEEESDGPPLLVDGLSLQDALDRLERQSILDALQKSRFNRTAAARLLGVTFRSLRYRMQRLGIKE